MELAKVIGTVIGTQKIEGIEGVKLLIIQPLDEKLKEVGEPLIAADSRSSAPGNIVYWVAGREATLAFDVSFTPVDAAIVGIVDRVDVER